MSITNVELPIYEFGLKSFHCDQPILQKNIDLDIAFDSPQDLAIWFDIKEGSEVVINTRVSVAAPMLTSNGNSPDGMFYVFKHRQSFIVNLDDITPIVVSELVLHHLGVVSKMIADYSVQVNTKKIPQPIKLHSLSKILLWVETQWK